MQPLLLSRVGRVQRSPRLDAVIRFDVDTHLDIGVGSIMLVINVVPQPVVHALSRINLIDRRFIAV